jgi:hypothetical protein
LREDKEIGEFLFLDLYNAEMMSEEEKEENYCIDAAAATDDSGLYSLFFLP